MGQNSILTHADARKQLSAAAIGDDAARHVVLVSVVTAAGYYVGALVGLNLQFAPSSVSGLWPLPGQDRAIA